MTYQSKFSTSQSFISTPLSGNQKPDTGTFSRGRKTFWIRLGYGWGVTLSRLLDRAYSSLQPLDPHKQKIPRTFASQTSLKLFEGWRSSAYLDGGGVLTIGWGRTENVKRGDVTTQAAEQQWLEAEILEISDHLRRVVKVKLTQGQFDALVCWSFNVGRAAVARSTLIKVLNNGRYELVPEQLKRWVYDNGHYVPGLHRRRVQEVAIWER